MAADEPSANGTLVDKTSHINLLARTWLKGYWKDCAWVCVACPGCPACQTPFWKTRWVQLMMHRSCRPNPHQQWWYLWCCRRITRCGSVPSKLPLVWRCHPWSFCHLSWCSCCVGCWGSLAICGHSHGICMACRPGCHFLLHPRLAYCGVRSCCCACCWRLPIFPWGCWFSRHACNGVPCLPAGPSCMFYNPLT